MTSPTPSASSDAATQPPRRLHWVAAAAFLVVATAITARSATTLSTEAWVAFVNPTLALLLLLVAYPPASRTVSLLLVVGFQVALTIAVVAISGNLGWGLYPSLPFNVAAYLVMASGGVFLAGTTTRSNAPKVIGVTFLSAVAFYITSNFGVWAAGFYSAPSYPLTWEGLTTCYVRALPHFRGTIGPVVAALVLFSPPVLDFLCQRRTSVDAATATHV